MFDFLTGFAPRKLKDLFRWVEYLYYNSAHIFAALKKFAEYPITEIEIDTENAVLKKNWETLLSRTINLRNVSIKTGLDLHLYGNSFISVYKPFNRFLLCEHCNAKSGITKVDYKFTLKAMMFNFKCPACDKTSSSAPHDERVTDKSRINIIRWDPKLMDINHNPITGQSVYYYTIPMDLKAQVEKGDKHIINTMPSEFLKAIQEDKNFEFAPDEIYHMKIDPPAGIESQWGFPPLTATIKLFFYTAVLRKANESIALDHLVPFRVLHPAPISGNADPATSINLANWRSELEVNLKRWRRDPLHLMFSPVALGVTQMGGQGRALLTLGEVKDAEDNIIAAMGIPREFLYGGLSFTGSAITLRMLENQLQTYTKHQDDQSQWVVNKIADITGWESVGVHYKPFKMIDDAQQKAVLMQLNSIKPIVSDTTLLSMNELDITEERDKRKQESLDEARMQAELQEEVTRAQNKLSATAKMEAQVGQQSNTGMGYDPQQVIGQAEQFVSQLMQADTGTQKSMMSHLSQEDPVFYAVVKDRMETRRTMERQQAVAQQRNGGVPQ